MNRPSALAILLSGCALCACRSNPPPPEPWMPTGADGLLVGADEANAEAQATIRDDNADAAYEELLAGKSGD